MKTYNITAVLQLSSSYTIGVTSFQIKLVANDLIDVCKMRVVIIKSLTLMGHHYDILKENVSITIVAQLGDDICAFNNKGIV